MQESRSFQDESSCRPSPAKGQGRLEKSLSSPHASAQTEDCVMPCCAHTEEIRLNASALSDPNSLRIPLSSDLTSPSVITALVDSGSTHCFVDSNFAHIHNIPLTSIPPISLKLFDGTSNETITQSASIPVTFDSGESMIIEMFVTPLEPSCSVVLGYNWLTRYNPLIDWVLGSITFRSQSTLSPMSSARSASLLSQKLCSTELLTSSSAPLCVTLISAAAYAIASKQSGSRCYAIHLSDPSVPSVSANSASVSDSDLSHIPHDYQDYADVFNKAKADTLAPHRPYDLKIELEEGASPPIGPMYSLSQSELATLREFIEEHLRIGFIRPTNSPHGAPVL